MYSYMASRYPRGRGISGKDALNTKMKVLAKAP